MVSETKDYFERLMSDPQFVAEEALDYCAGEMTNCLKRTDELEGIVQQAHAMTARDRLRISQQGARIAELEAENQAFREFVAADDDLSEAYEQYALTGGEPSAGVDESVARKHAARQRLATDHGLPLPEVER